MGTHLTDTEVRNAKLPEGKRVHNLTDLPGLYLRIRAGKGAVGKDWLYRYKMKGWSESRWYKLGSYPQMSLASARVELAAHQAHVATGRDPKDVRADKVATREAAVATAALGTSPVTLDDLVSRWLTDYCRKIHTDNGALVAARYRNHVQNKVGKLRLEHLKASSFTELLLHIEKDATGTLADKGMGRTRDLVLTMLQQIYGWAIRVGHTERNPVAALSLRDFGKKSKPRQRVLSLVEIKLLHHLVEHSTMRPRWKHFLWLMLASGTRVFETTLAEVNHFDLKAGTWFIPKENQKKLKGELPPRDHIVDLSPFAMRHVEALIHMASAGEADRRSAVVIESGDEVVVDVPTAVLTKSGKFFFPSRLRNGEESAADRKTFSHMVGDRQLPVPKHGRTQSSDELMLPGGRWTTQDLRRTMATQMGELEVRPDVIDRCQSHIVAGDSASTGVYQHQEVRGLMKAAWLKWGETLEQLISTAQTDTKTNQKIAEQAKERLKVRFEKQASTMKVTKLKNGTLKARQPKDVSA